MFKRMTKLEMIQKIIPTEDKFMAISEFEELKNKLISTPLTVVVKEEKKEEDKEEKKEE
jgi:hypothetical protein